MPVELNNLTKGWMELESDPGLFTLLLEDFGVKGVQVEEIYDLQKPIEGPVYGFIFLFKWIEERRSRRKVVIADECFVRDETIVNSIFFAHQIVPNSCATHALLSVLLNCEKMDLGETLTRLKDYTNNMSPENKGYAIGNTPELARAHNSHAKPEPRRIQEKQHGIPTSRTIEAFHFVSYVPINGHLFELDGLKPYPIDHGPWDSSEDWTERFRLVITERLGMATGGEPYHDIRFNLMAVVPDRRTALESKLRTLKINRQIVLEALQQLVKVTSPQLNSAKVDVNSGDSAMMDAGVSTSAAPSSPPANNTSSNCSTPTRSRVPLMHPALVSHNYAKSPLLEGHTDDSDSRPRYEQYSGSEYSSDSEDDETADTDCSRSPVLPPPPRLVASGPGCPLAPNATNPVPLRPISVNTKDFSKPLSIQTKFETSPTPSCSSTDTSSEVGSAFNSPVRSLPFASPLSGPTMRDFKRFVVIRVSGSKDTSPDGSTSTTTTAAKRGDQPPPPSLLPPPSTSAFDTGGDMLRKRTCSETGNEAEPIVTAGTSKRMKTENLQPSPREFQVSSSTMDVAPTESGSRAVNVQSTFAGRGSTGGGSSGSSNSKESPKYPQLIEPHTFAPKDLLALLKNIENEISTCESTLRDEVEKKKKYRIDDCRRTHNYDQFIRTFLSMLECHGMLQDLIEQNMAIRRRQGINVGRLHRIKKVDRKRKAKPRKRK